MWIIRIGGIKMTNMARAGVNDASQKCRFWKGCNKAPSSGQFGTVPDLKTKINGERARNIPSGHWTKPQLLFIKKGGVQGESRPFKKVPASSQPMGHSTFDFFSQPLVQEGDPEPPQKHTQELWEVPGVDQHTQKGKGDFAQHMAI